MVLDVAWKLGKDPSDVKKMDTDDFVRWVAFFNIEHKRKDARFKAVLRALGAKV